MASNYYEILGVSQDATSSEIRAAYRQKAKKYHPDSSKYNDAEILFKQVKSAYNVLNNQRKRDLYSQLEHDEYVERRGGYTAAEIEQATEASIRLHEEQQTNSERNWKREQQQQVQQQQAASGSQSLFQRLYSIAINGQTPASTGQLAFLIRSIVYLFLTILIGIPVYVILPFEIFTFPVIATILLVSRLVYLVGFEHLRSEYIKIDMNPEPDAYTMPYPLGVGVIVVILGFILFLTLPIDSDPSTMIQQVGVILIVIMLFFTIISVPALSFWAIVSIGVAVSDDYYNLWYDVNPVFWNFAAQVPILLIIADFIMIYFSPGEHYLSLPQAAILFYLPLLICLIYLLLYHREVLYELRWRIMNNQIYPGAKTDK